MNQNFDFREFNKKIREIKQKMWIRESLSRFCSLEMC